MLVGSIARIFSDARANRRSLPLRPIRSSRASPNNDRHLWEPKKKASDYRLAPLTTKSASRSPHSVQRNRPISSCQSSVTNKRANRITVEKSIMPMPARAGRRQRDPALKLHALKKKPLPWGEGPKSSRIAHANNGVSWQGLECPNGKRMSLESILNFGATWLSSPGPNTVSPICARRQRGSSSWTNCPNGQRLGLLLDNREDLMQAWQIVLAIARHAKLGMEQPP